MSTIRKTIYREPVFKGDKIDGSEEPVDKIISETHDDDYDNQKRTMRLNILLCEQLQEAGEIFGLNYNKYYTYIVATILALDEEQDPEEQGQEEEDQWQWVIKWRLLP